MRKKTKPVHTQDMRFSYCDIKFSYCDMRFLQIQHLQKKKASSHTVA
jgi:hypothetical protein